VFLPNDHYQQVDLYVGGPEHACMHLIYARFIHMVLFDMGIVPVEEPFKRVIHQGMITKDGKKMSKSWGNTVNPDDYDAAELRFHLMFIGHYFDGGDWSDDHIKGVQRFFKRMRTWLGETGEDTVDIDGLEKLIDGYVVSFKFNKVVSSFMEFYNRNKAKKMRPVDAERIAGLLDVFAPEWR
jgi:leucyl-tRNA synthetase